MSVQVDKNFTVVGEEITFENAEKVKALGYARVDNHQGDDELVVDLGGLTHANSVTVAVMMAWHRYALARQKNLSFAHLSPGLLNIVEFSGLNPVLSTR